MPIAVIKCNKFFDKFEYKEKAELAPIEKTLLKSSSCVDRIVKEDIRNIYQPTSLLGTGSFGSVRLAHRLSHPKKLYSIKTIPREVVIQDLESIEAELSTL